MLIFNPCVIFVMDTACSRGRLTLDSCDRPYLKRMHIQGFERPNSRDTKHFLYMQIHLPAGVNARRQGGDMAQSKFICFIFFSGQPEQITTELQQRSIFVYFHKALNCTKEKLSWVKKKCKTGLFDANRTQE